MGDVIKFADPSKIQYDPLIDSDGYLKTTALNALDMAGYEVSPEGVRLFQEMNGLEVTGKLSVKDFALLITVFDDKKISQQILNYLNVYGQQLYRKTNAKAIRRNAIKILILYFFGGYGIVSFIMDIINMIF